MTDHEKRHLRRALDAYSEEECVRGDYQLWVGFGDNWTSLKAKLVRDGYLSALTGSATRLSARGKALLASFEPAAA